MYYYTGKTANRVITDKNINVAGDIIYFINQGAVYDEYHGYYFKEAEECFFLPKEQTITIDDIPITNPGTSGFFTKEEMLAFTPDATVCLGKLQLAPDILNLTGYLTKNFDDRSQEIDGQQTLEVYWSNMEFNKFTIDDLNVSQYLLSTPIRSIQINDTVYSDHVFLFSTFYTLRMQTNMKLYIIPSV